MEECHYNGHVRGNEEAWVVGSTCEGLKWVTSTVLCEKRVNKDVAPAVVKWNNAMLQIGSLKLSILCACVEKKFSFSRCPSLSVSLSLCLFLSLFLSLSLSLFLSLSLSHLLFSPPPPLSLSSPHCLCLSISPNCTPPPWLPAKTIHSYLSFLSSSLFLCVQQKREKKKRNFLWFLQISV